MTSLRPNPGPNHAAPAAPEPSLGELTSQLTEQVSRLVRDEIALAQAEIKERGKKLGVGAGLFGGAAVLGYFGLGVLIAAAVLGLATTVDAWLAALIVGVALLALAGVVALVGKSNVKQGSPPVPTDAIASVQADVAAVKHAVKR
ncbi:MAG: phage holin family protein [Jatrophihabitans sp.]